MWDGDGREAGQTSSSAAQRSPDPAQQPPLPDAGRRPEQTDIQGDVPSDLWQWFAADADALPEGFPPVPEAGSPAWHGYHSRQIIREFLRAVPRARPDAVLVFTRPDGTPRSISREQLSAAIDRLRPRQRIIVRLGVEERWSRQRVCAYLNNLSIKTYERDHQEALAILSEL
jgi:hypothetical protein